MARISRTTKLIVIGGVVSLLGLAWLAAWLLRVCCAPPLPPVQ
jgi:hypothetical protein